MYGETMRGKAWQGVARRGKTIVGENVSERKKIRLICWRNKKTYKNKLKKLWRRMMKKKINSRNENIHRHNEER